VHQAAADDKKNRMNLKKSSLHLAALLGSVTALLSAESNLTMIVTTDDPAPDGNGRFAADFESPAININGEVAFSAGLKSTSGGGRDNRGIFLANGTGITQIARGGQPVPGGNGVFRSSPLSMSFAPLLNDAGEVAFWAELSNTSGGTKDNEGVFRGNRNGLLQIVRKGQSTPGGSDSFLLPIGLVGDGFALNSSGQVAFNSPLDDGVNSEVEGVFRGDGSNLLEIARGSSVLGFALNDAGEVAFTTYLDESSQEVIFRGTGVAPAVEMAAEGQIAPDGDGSFVGFYAFALNNNGQIAFRGQVEKADPCCDFYSGLFLTDGTTLAQIVREGQAAPDGNGVFGELGFDRFPMNQSGQVAFLAQFTHTANGDDDDHGIFRGNGGALTQIVRDGQASPDGNGKFAFNETDFFSFGIPKLNDAGQVAFGWTLADTANGDEDSTGIFLFDDARGLIQVARKGDPLLGSTITDLDLDFDDATPLNNRGQIAFAFELDDRRAGIAIWSMPSPPSPQARLSGAFDASSKLLTISWSTALTGWDLQATSDPSNPQSWNPIPAQPVTVGQEFQVKLPTEEPKRFFRLRQR